MSKHFGYTTTQQKIYFEKIEKEINLQRLSQQNTARHIVHKIYYAARKDRKVNGLKKSTGGNVMCLLYQFWRYFLSSYIFKLLSKIFCRFQCMLEETFRLITITLMIVLR